jgi:gamma-glutamyl phosphate reductase
VAIPSSENRDVAPASENMSESAPIDVARAAKAAFEASQLVPHSERVRALNEIRNVLEIDKEKVLEANRLDLEVLSCDWIL